MKGRTSACTGAAGRTTSGFRVVRRGPVTGEEVGRAAGVAQAPGICILREKEERICGVWSRDCDGDVGSGAVVVANTDFGTDESGPGVGSVVFLRCGF